MTNREQAILDVATACRVGYDDVAEWCIDARPNSVAYAVALRDRVLDLEAELKEWRGCGGAQLDARGGGVISTYEIWRSDR